MLACSRFMIPSHARPRPLALLLLLLLLLLLAAAPLLLDARLPPLPFRPPRFDLGGMAACGGFAARP